MPTLNPVFGLPGPPNFGCITKVEGPLYPSQTFSPNPKSIFLKKIADIQGLISVKNVPVFSS
jgi:hypothetical protein